MATKQKQKLDFCCDELKWATAVRPEGYSKTWDWPYHLLEVAFGKTRLVVAGHEPNETLTMTLDHDYMGGDFDFTPRYCPFCGEEVDF